MAFGDVTITLRPIKFAFLVNPVEHEILDRAIQANLFQWGGLHNPIVPIHRRLPAYWSDLPTGPTPPAEICTGYLRVFDPDAVIVCGSVDKSIVPSHVQHVHTLGEFEGDLIKEDAQNFGVGLFDVLNDFTEREFKYTRRDGLKILMPEFGRRWHRISLRAGWDMVLATRTIFGLPCMAAQSLVPRFCRQTKNRWRAYSEAACSPIGARVPAGRLI
jgi:hypothetical protein